MQKVPFIGIAAWKYAKSQSNKALPHVDEGSSSMVYYGNSTGTYYLQEEAWIMYQKLPKSMANN